MQQGRTQLREKRIVLQSERSAVFVARQHAVGPVKPLLGWMDNLQCTEARERVVVVMVVAWA
jgi:hypothetical protein